MIDRPETHDQPIPTVSRVVGDTIIELVYDADRRKTALAVSRFGGLWNVEQQIQIETGEILVPYSARNNLITNECVLLPSQPEHHGNKRELLADIEAFLHRYVDLSPLFERIAAHYVLLSWVHDPYNEIPYLRLKGPLGRGKTRGLLAIGSLCYKPFFASGASTISPIFHTLDNFGGTLVLDEADLRFSNATSDLVKLYNNGATRGLPVLRTMPNRHREFNPRAFRVFGPKIIAMRGSFEDQALESRFFTEEMGGRALRPNIPISLPASFKAEALALRNRLLHFRFCHLLSVKPDAGHPRDDVEPRLNQMALPLLSLIDDADLANELCTLLAAKSATKQEQCRNSVEGQLLSAVCRVLAAAPGQPAGVGAVTEQFNSAQAADYRHAVSSKWVGHMLRHRLRLVTNKSNGIYVIPVFERPKIDALAASYGIDQHEIHTSLAA